MKVLVSLVIAMAALTACGQKPAEKNPSAGPVIKTPPPPKVSLSNVKDQCGYSCSVMYITGEIKNNTDKKLTVFVKYEILNKQGHIIGTASDLYSGLNPNDVWKFKAGSTAGYQDAKQFRLSELKAM